jgi:hypothetical protein
MLTLAARGLPLSRIGGELGMSLSEVNRLVAEGCEAVLRGGLASPDAERVCGRRWRGWCRRRGDTDACTRLLRPADNGQE